MAGETKERILEAALELFAQSGYSGTSMNDIAKQLGITKDSRILCFSTEGDTDRENYRRIVWDGTYARG